MTPQLIILKIQSLLGGHSGLSTMDKRALAMEYFRLCSQTQSALEHCVALIKSGRDYAALQFAESGKLLDSINVLTFAELPAWRDFCSINDFINASTERMPVGKSFEPLTVTKCLSEYTRISPPSTPFKPCKNFCLSMPKTYLNIGSK